MAAAANGDGNDKRHSLSIGSTRGMVALEVGAYVVIAVLLIAACFVEGRMEVAIFTAVAGALAIFVGVSWPLHTSVFDALVGAFGGFGMIYGTETSLTEALPKTAGMTGPRRLRRHVSARFDAMSGSELLHWCTLWAGALLIVLAAFVILGFLHQMLRRERTNMVLSLSRGLMFDVAMAGASGWVFAPALLRYFGVGTLGACKPYVVAIVVVIAVALLAALSWASTRWAKDYRASGSPLPRFKLEAGNGKDVRNFRSYALYSLGLMPVMYGGFVVFLALVALLVFVG
ncbi:MULTISPECIES: hypothetical protein [unclassified Bifidobacterium]|uniref:hypothetical protein n=1 Tax=unclassified Bifidobacterium TaxID=2608897 RepID=UPI0023F75B67|nr:MULTISPECIES: hypothetical protein [unclassified Bifidobacterium]WEV65629.1 hypothetical protein OZX71_07745 [Bifidobacterium sp. ESL0764]WEV75587.1 hypothetical protein OZX75_08215 [Bifidobacterium sp. ESL0800]